MKNGGSILIVALILGFALLIYFYLENKKLREARNQAEMNYLKLLEEYLKKTNSFPDSVKQQLTDLQNKYGSLDQNIGDEFVKVIQLMETGQEEIAVEKITKITENVLRELVEREVGRKLSGLRFVDIVKRAFHLSIICKHTKEMINKLRKMRNKQAHEVNVKLTEEEKSEYVLTGIEVLLELAGRAKPALTN